jgi:putative membrane protein
MKFIRNLLVFIFLCAVLLVGMSFAVQNTARVPLDLLFIQLGERSLSLWVLLAFATGGVIGMLTSIGVILRLRASLMQARRSLRAAEKASPAKSETAAPALSKNEV